MSQMGGPVFEYDRVVIIPLQTIKEIGIFWLHCTV